MTEENLQVSRKSVIVSQRCSSLSHVFQAFGGARTSVDLFAFVRIRSERSGLVRMRFNGFGTFCVLKKYDPAIRDVAEAISYIYDTKVAALKSSWS